jgi:hypothetical protein
LFVRLSESNKEELLKNKGAELFEPMPGRPMKGYIILPKSWRDRQTETLRKWVSLSLEYVAKLPPKKKKTPTKKK